MRKWFVLAVVAVLLLARLVYLLDCWQWVEIARGQRAAERLIVRERDE